jgi:hypothetical protein
VIYPNKCIPTKCMQFDPLTLTKDECPVSCNPPE